jgi:CDP-diacylglycerol--glycerol-3-phosphate 3-phosphatidyltransferase
MTLASKVTTLRIVLAPVFFAVYNFYKLFFPDLSRPAGLWQYWQLPVLYVIFTVAELSDFFDGRIARKENKVSDFGKLYDPFADTILQITLFVCFAWDGILPVIPLLLVLYREFGIFFVRNLMLKKGITMGARMGGKIKTVAYITTAILAILAFSLRTLRLLFPVNIYQQLYAIVSTVTVVVFWLAVIVALVSFADYVRVYRKAK